MKNKLTVNDIALANIRQRKKQYLIMIIGIVLAMVFSGSIVFFMAAANFGYLRYISGASHPSLFGFFWYPAALVCTTTQRS